MARRLKGAELVERWRRDQENLTAQALAEAVGDSGGQIVKWLNGSRDRLPLKLKVALARRTGLQLSSVCEASEMKLARELFALLARDAAASNNGSDGDNAAAGVA